MKTKLVGYWVTTALVAFAFGVGGAFDLLRSPDIMAVISHLGYPAYLAPLLGAWKLPGVAVLLSPGLPRLKEWAYAGMTFDLTGAVVSHASVGDPASALAAPALLLALVGASWALRPEGRRLDAAPAPRRERAPRAGEAPQAA